MPTSGGLDLSIVLAYTVGLILAYFVLRLLWTPAKVVLRLGYALVIGAAAIGAINLVGAYIGLHVPFNVLSVLGAGLLGLPGIVLVIALGGLL